MHIETGGSSAERFRQVTTINIMTGMFKDSGQVFIDRHDISEMPPIRSLLADAPTRQ